MRRSSPGALAFLSPMAYYEDWGFPAKLGRSQAAAWRPWTERVTRQLSPHSTKA